MCEELRENKFRELLKRVDITGAQLARRLGITPSAVAYWCRNQKAPPMKRVPEIAKYLGCSEEEIIKCFM